MSAPIAPIGAIMPITSFTPAADVGPVAAANAASAASAASAVGAVGAPGSFAAALADGLDAVAASQHRADQLSVAAASGQLVDPAALTIAMTEAQLMTQLATTVQAKAVQSFNTIMSMQA